MHDFETILTALGAFLGGLVAVYKAWGAGHRSDFQESIKTLQNEVAQKEKDTEFYRQRWQVAEKSNEEKDRTIERLKRELEKLKNEKH